MANEDRQIGDDFYRAAVAIMNRDLTHLSKADLIRMDFLDSFTLGFAIGVMEATKYITEKGTT